MSDFFCGCDDSREIENLAATLGRLSKLADTLEADAKRAPTSAAEFTLVASMIRAIIADDAETITLTLGTVRTCPGCGAKLLPGSRRDKRTCSSRCRQRINRKPRGHR